MDETIVLAELFSTLHSNYPLIEVSVFFNGSEYSRQKHFASQNTLNFGLNMFKQQEAFIVNRSYDDSHLRKSWYTDAINRFKLSNTQTFNNEFLNVEEKLYGPQFISSVDSMNNGVRFDHYTISMNLRSSFDATLGSFEVPVKSYDAASSGVWFGPFYDCKKNYENERRSLRMSYTVPIITSMTKPPM